ncbi:trigger factor [Atopobacter sp. AH10]|uniref:trigger factor n=1 Tax=Atopobacter sp. AH10 TaxID=2315861 RepID=UPI000EF22761|nr:trigger factor [Atopobacter sp. AH10]RLK63198.1 trigger factor [Atopobacter sp. AH10]
MSTNFEKLENGYGKLTFTIDEQTSKEAVDRVFNRVKKNLNVPGFRKGKVSRTIFNKMFGEESLYQDALNDILPVVYTQAIEEAGIDVVGQPELSIESLEKGKEWTVSAKVPVKPEVKLGQYEGLEVAKQDREVSDEDVDKAIEAERAKLAELVLKEDAPAEEGDTVIIDYKGFVGDEAFEGGEAKNHALELGSKSFIPGFEDQLIGSKEGDQVTVNVTFPEQYHAADLAGKEARFEVTVHEVKEKELPELDDEFAKDVSDEYETLEDLKAAKRQELVDAKKEAAVDAIQEEAINKAIENATIVDLPQAMVDQEIDKQLEHYLNNLRRQGIDPELYYQITGTSEADLRSQFAAGADTRTKTNLILEAIVKDKAIEVTDEEVEAEIKELAETYEMEAEKVRQAVSKEMLSSDIKLKKALALIVDSVVEK